MDNIDQGKRIFAVASLIKKKANYVMPYRIKTNSLFNWRLFCQTVVLLMLVVGQAEAQQAIGTTLHESAASNVENGKIGTGEPWETQWYKVDSGVPGPKVLIVGGVHGNEPAGFRAADQVRHWAISKGSLIVVPQVNRIGLAANMRWIPEFRNDRKSRDLNRNFPTEDRSETRTELAKAVWDFAKRHKPDWVFDLHEGFDFNRQNSKSVGSSVIAFPGQSEFARALVRAVNADIQPDKQFKLLAGSGPVVGSFARACEMSLGAKSFIFETTTKKQPLSLRTRQHRQIVSTALQRIGVVDQSMTDSLAPASSRDVIRVAVFDDSGAHEPKVIAAIDNRPGVFVCHVGRQEMEIETLRQFDVLVFPGGSGSKQGKAIGAKGREQIRQYVRDGGGVVGICAGAYLCSSHYRWSLNLMNASVFNKMVDVPGKGLKSMWYRGPGTNVDVEVTSRGGEIMGLAGTHAVRYQNGPILSPGTKAGVPPYETLAQFRSENGIYSAQKNTMTNTPAVVTSSYGFGRVIAISPHFESTPGMEDVLLNAIRFVTKRSSNR